MNTHHTDLTRTVRLTALCLALLQAWSVHAEPSQTPLLNPPGGKPLPNMMLTLDDSGSMTHNYLPEDTFTLNNQSVYFPPDQRIYVHPEEISKNIYALVRTNLTSMTYDGVTKQHFYSTRFVTAVPPSEEGAYLPSADAKLYQYQLRSPQLNTIYYNPAIKYDPWTGVKTDGSQYSFNSPDPEAAPLDPLALDPESQNYPAGWIDSSSTVNLSAPSKVYKVYWAQRRDPQDPLKDPQDPLRTSPNPNIVARPYVPGLLYLLKDGADPTQTASYLAYNLNDDSTSVSYPWGFTDRKDCKVAYSTGDVASQMAPGSTECSKKAELQNFTNWFVFHRSRLFIAQGGVPDALKGYAKIFRMGWGTLRPGVTYNNGIPSDDLSRNSYDVDGVKSKTVQQGMREWTTDTKRGFTKWLRLLKTYAGTPTRQAVASATEYFKRTDEFSPWSSDMIHGTPLSDHLSCRRSYNLVLTDGYYTGQASDDTKVGQQDDNGSFAIDKLTYPFKDLFEDTLADYVMQSWLNDLQPDIANNVPPDLKTPKANTEDAKLVAKITSDPATHQHLTYFMLGFGVSGNIFQKSMLSNPAAYDQTLLDLANCPSGGLCWKDPLLSAPNKIDDLGHAALNSRGLYYSVNDKKELKRALDDIFKRGTGDGASGGVATASPSLVANNIEFVPTYKPFSWEGDITAYIIDEKGGSPKEKWVASKQLPAPSARQIYAWNGLEAIPLDSAATIVKSAAPSSSITATDIIEFLKGNDSSTGTTRQRGSNKLPDFINSTPLYVLGGQDLGYASTGMTGAANYSEYLSSKASRPDGLLFVGGNGGMLHAFSTTTGVEQFAYVPGAVLPNLPQLAAPDYGYPSNLHQYFVDGQIVETDIFVGEGQQAHWQNIVVGTLGAGGKAVFALQLKTADLAENLGQKTVLWEVTHPDMGYITSAPQVGRLANGSWKVFVGNGSESSTGVAALLMIDIATHEVQSIPVANPSPSISGLGMGGVSLMVDKNTGNVTNVYAGDSAGRLWRFDATSSGIEKGYNGKPLFTATSPDGSKIQPITAAPIVYTQPLGGQMVVFQAGRLLYDTDGTELQAAYVQSAYGIWDKKTPATATSAQDPPSISRADLQTQSVTDLKFIEIIKGHPEPYYYTSSNKIIWEAQYGWVFDLAFPNNLDAGATTVYPKGIYDPQRLGGGVLLTSVLPGSATQSCSPTGATSYNVFLRALTGARVSTPTIDTNLDGKVDEKDQTVNAYVSDGAKIKILPDPKDPSEGCAKGLALDPTKGKLLQICDSLRIQDRIWRELLNPPHP